MNADKFVVRGQTYDVLSPATFGDYIETVGAACINPLGYDENKLFLAYDDNVQKLFRATAAIAYSELLIKDTNCEPTTMAEALANALSAGGVSYDNTDSGLTASNVQDAIDEVNGDVETVNNDLSNVDTVISENGAKNLAGPIYAISQVLNGLTISVNTNSSSDDYGTITVSGTATAKTDIDIVNRDTFHLGPGAYKVSGCPSGGSANSYLLLGRTDGAWGAWADIGSGEVVNVLTSFTGFVLRIASGTVITTPIVFKPMITLADQPNSDYAHYVPYAKTNRELTEEHEWKKAVVTGCELTQAGSVTTTVSEIVGAKEVVFIGTYIPNIALPNVGLSNMEMGWTYYPAAVSDYRASGTINVNFTNGNVVLKAAEFPHSGTVKITSAYYR